MSKAFPLPLITKWLDGRLSELQKPFVYITKKGDRIEPSVGFRFDWGSIPKLFWSIIGGPTGKYGPATLIHDFLYFTLTTTRKYADLIFLEAMKELGVSFWKRKIMFYAVRSFGWIPWNKRNEQLKIEEMLPKPSISL